MRILREDQPILDALAAAAPNTLARTLEWCAVNSGSRNAQGLARQRALLAETMSALPGRLERAPLPASREVLDDGALSEAVYEDALLLTVRPEAPVQAVLTGHFDTVYPPESPFQTVKTRADGALWGPGVADMKGGISVMLAALEAFEAHPARDKVGYRVLLSPDEEIGSPGSASLLHKLGSDGHVGLTYEPALADGTLAGARKGSGNFHIRVKGRSAHAGRDFEKGRNAVAGAAEIALALHALNSQREGVTVNVAKISGGSPLNVVPDVAIVRFNVRTPSSAAAEWVRCEIEKIAIAESLTGQRGLEVSLHGGFTRPPKPLDAAQLALLEGVKAAAGLLGQEIAWRASGGVCEGNNLHAAGLPNVDTLGVRGGDIHSEAEHAIPESFLERAHLSAMILMKLASGDIDARRLKALWAARMSARADDLRRKEAASAAAAPEAARTSHVVRPAGPADLEALMELAVLSGPGFTSLPEHEPTLRERLEVSRASFSGELNPLECWYTLMLEDAETGAIDGVAGVKAAVGLKRPFFSFRVVTLAQYSQQLQFVDHRSLVLVNECAGWSEVGSLFVKPEKRQGGAGRLLAQSRYMLIASDPQRFAEMVLAELRGYFEEDGGCPFWDHVASKFFRIPFGEADRMSASTDGQFILDLAPRHPIYVELLPEPARQAIGRVHREGEAARALLEREGFREIGLVDIFDAGPTVACRRDDIRSVREGQRRRVELSAAPEGPPQLIATDGLVGFRAVRAVVAVDGERAYLSAETAERLRVKQGDWIRVKA